MTVSILFFMIAAVICLGFAGNWLFRITRIPDSLLLIAAGFGLRALLGVQTDLVQTAAPYFGAFALLVILFEGGLHLDLEHMLRSWRQALALLSASFLLSFVLILLLVHVIFGRSLLTSALLSSAVACTSAAIVIPLIRQVKAEPRIRTILELESSLSDAVAVLFTVIVLNLVTGGEGLNQLGPVLFSSLTGALVVGIGAGIAWIWVLKKLAGQPLLYLMTFAGMLMVFSVSEALHSSGVFGVFMFSLTFSNGPYVLSRLVPHFQTETLHDQLAGEDIKRFHAELTFLVRTFFFVFLGMLFDPSALTLLLVIEAVAIYAMVLLARALAVRFSFLHRSDGEGRRGVRVLFLFMPRGLATAVLATLPAAYGLGGTGDFVAVAVLIILFTNAAVTLGVRWVEERAP
jgi:cell volume regulation protein A